jgi:hypothetical protein
MIIFQITRWHLWVESLKFFIKNFIFIISIIRKKIEKLEILINYLNKIVIISNKFYFSLQNTGTKLILKMYKDEAIEINGKIIFT